MSKFQQILDEAYSAIGAPQQNAVQPVQPTTAAPGLSATNPNTQQVQPQGAQPAVQGQPTGTQAGQAPVPGVQQGAIDLDPNTNRILQNVLAKQGKGLQLSPDEQKLLGVYNQRLMQQNQVAQRALNTVTRVPTV